MSRVVLSLLVVMAVALAAPNARAQTPPPDLMARLGAYAVRFETMRTHASYRVEGKLDSLDRSGRVDETKFMRARVDANGHDVQFSILQYLEDGQDKTADAKAKQQKRRDEAAREPPSQKREWRMPFHPGEQPRYFFDQVEVDPHDANRVRIAFRPKIQEDDTIEGSVWVDARAGTIISAGFKLSKPPTLVDSVHVTMTFGAQTRLGPAPSRIDVDAQASALFIRKHYRGEATLSAYSLVP
jgi:hypothetical protein